MDLIKIIHEFQVEGVISSVEPYGEGHINQTYLATGDKKRYILQKINTKLFTEPDKLMFNIKEVTEWICKVHEKQGLSTDRLLKIVPTKNGDDFLQNEDGAFRVYDFIENATSHQQADEKKFYQSAVAFGQFAEDLSAFDASVLHDVLPFFHDTTVRFSAFEKAVNADMVGRKASCQAEIDFYMARKKYCDMIVSRLADGRLPLRVTHNDTKLNNVMLDDATDKPVAVIDLDTVMPGSVCYDFGDSIRFGCNTGAEDEPNLDKVHFSLPLYKSYLKGYLSTFKTLTDEEKKMLPYGAIIMTYECGMRFLTDYLQGDTYFRTSRENQNLDRCRTHIRLIEEMEANFDEMQVK